MLNINKKAFTLVELIVVITILAILGTIGFISLQGYSSEARDSKRVTDLGQVRTGIQVYQAKEGVVPEPNDAITVGSGSTIYTIQGYAGTGTLRSIKVNTDAKDPLENDYYTYTTNGAKTKFQLLALLENNNTAYNNVIPTTYANYENRDSYTIGDQLGTLLEPLTNIPVQELGNNIDLSVDLNEYSAVFSKNDIQLLAGLPLYQEIVARSENTGVEEENIVYSSCKEILDNNASAGDGIYTIDPENNGVGFDVYCDMGTDGGGWTLVYKNLNSSGLLYNNMSSQGNLSCLTNLNNNCSAKFSDTLINLIKTKTGDYIGYRTSTPSFSQKYFWPGACEYRHDSYGNSFHTHPSATYCIRYSNVFTKGIPSYIQCDTWGGNGAGLNAWYRCNGNSNYTNVSITHRGYTETGGMNNNPNGSNAGSSSTSYGNSTYMWVR